MTGLFGSLSFRLALTYVGLFVTSLLVIAGTFYLIAIHMPLEAARTQVEQEARILRNTYVVDGSDALLAGLREHQTKSGPHKAFHAFIDANGRTISANLRSWPREPADGWLRLEADDYLEGDEVDYEPLTLDHRFADGARLLVGRDIEDISEVEEVLQSGALAVVAVAIIVGLVGGGLMSFAIGRRIETFSSTARRVMAGDLSQRVPVRGSRDDFDRLAETLNLMLARIEEALEAVRRVSDSVAHELRTPLSRLRADLEDAIAGPDRDRAAKLISATDEADRLDRIFDAVLRIARIESGRHSANMRTVDLSTLLEDAVDYYRPAAEEADIAFTAAIEPELKVTADADLIFQAVTNLIDNAIKYTGPGGRIMLAAQGRAGSVIVELTDNGQGIEAEHRTRVTERFYRAPLAENVPGIGLGLSLVAAVAALHDSQIAFEDADPGLRVRWTLQIAQST
ncbi:MAG: ATP-binding protein [Sphingomonadaceae bacterium]